MKNAKIFTIIITSLILSSCSSQKLEIVEIGPIKEIRVVETLNLSLKDTLNAPLSISCYEISHTNTFSISSIKILNIDSLQSRIKYPAIAIRAGVEGTILIELTFEDNDEIKNIKPISNIGAGMEESVINSIKDFKFKFDKKISKNSSVLLIVNFIIVLKNRYSIPTH